MLNVICHDAVTTPLTTTEVTTIVWIKNSAGDLFNTDCMAVICLGGDGVTYGLYVDGTKLTIASGDKISEIATAITRGDAILEV